MARGHVGDAILTVLFVRTKYDENPSLRAPLKGVLKLYSKMLHGGQWEGSPVKEVNGCPSVHCILERIGVIGSEEEFDDNVDVETRRERPLLAPIQEAHLTSKVNKSPRKGAKKPSEARIAQRPVSSPQTMIRPMVHVPRTSCRSQTAHLASPSSSETRSGMFGIGSCSTPSTWDSPGFAEDLFHTPAHTPMTLCEPGGQDQREADLNKSQRRFSASVQSGQIGDSTQDSHSMIPLPLEPGFETYSAENFVEATCEMNFYGWESNNALGVGGESRFLPQGHSPWNPGVFV
ncbi:hypothetical protein LTR99_001034 [Exophiala xenobiotica]|uniref:Uncharacterized protein n=1 Tax=Vermiconidia calcicola TaxID=1690605 RepID=A0AAV9QM61_9PEZI|nr:hypothetical protein LTR92_001466 [Exophiala xenobiotica]KAK5534832.1 hypothetical protein LTR23_008628 [Chaetothyriales sp. CCFEE 6169]KAK5545597.1 hypothetical protein LTR25_000604 [Vermiconidia calcicola]KAK5208515.1 hypothetical protein LTR41_005741 [Exophiala xenobiotica]KAK5230020.1 hypothetical protein LTR72_001555 [Exophiala xenobiotica]